MWLAATAACQGGHKIGDLLPIILLQEVFSRQRFVLVQLGDFHDLATMFLESKTPIVHTPYQVDRIASFAQGYAALPARFPGKFESFHDS